MARVATGVIDVDEQVQEVWSKLLIVAREKNLLFRDLFNHKYEAEFSGVPYDTINVGNVSNWSTGATEFSANGEGVVATTGLDTVDADELIAANSTIGAQIGSAGEFRHYYFAIEVAKDIELFANPALWGHFIEKIGYHMALEEDTLLAGFIDDLSQTGGVLGVSFEDEDIIEAIRVLNTANVPYSDRVYVFSEYQDAEYKKTERYTNQDYKSSVGELKTARERGFVGNVHGLAWYTGTNVEGSSAGHDNGIWQKEALEVIEKDHLRTEGPAYEILSDSNLYAVHNVYTAKELRDDHGYWAKGK